VFDAALGSSTDAGKDDPPEQTAPQRCGRIVFQPRDRAVQLETAIEASAGELTLTTEERNFVVVTTERWRITQPSESRKRKGEAPDSVVFYSATRLTFDDREWYKPYCGLTEFDEAILELGLPDSGAE
jgi:hypothetical protein